MRAVTVTGSVRPVVGSKSAWVSRPPVPPEKSESSSVSEPSASTAWLTTVVEPRIPLWFLHETALPLGASQTTFYGESLNCDLDVVREIVADPYLMPGVSDGGAHTKFITVGRFPTEFLTDLVRDNQMCSLEHAHYRLSALPARTVGLVDRSTLEVGKAADVVIYDYDKLTVGPMEVAYDFPGDEWRRIQKAFGYRYVLVNGEVTIEDDKETRHFSGRLLRRGH